MSNSVTSTTLPTAVLSLVIGTYAIGMSGWSGENNSTHPDNNLSYAYKLNSEHDKWEQFSFTFTISDASSNARIKIKADANDIVLSANYSNGDHTIYYNHGGYGSPKTLKIEGRTDGSGSAFKITNISWKEVTSNTGVLI